MRIWTLRDIKAKVKADFDLKNQPFVTDSELVGYINEAIDIAESEIHEHNLDDGYFATFSDISLKSGKNGYKVPDDMYACKILGIVQNVGGEQVEIPMLQGEGKYSLLSELDYGPLRVFNGTKFVPYRFTMFHRNAVEGYRIILTPTPKEDVENGITVYYIRNANRLVDDDDVCDIPEFVNTFVVLYAKNEVSKKERHGPGIFTEDVEKAKQSMNKSLSVRVPGATSYIRGDASFYSSTASSTPDYSPYRGYGNIERFVVKMEDE